MTRDEMLQELGLGDEEFRDYLEQLTAFHNSLSDKQRVFHKTTLKPAAQVLTAFGPGATMSNLHELFSEAPVVDGMAPVNFHGKVKTP